jgi:NADPH:quinone reductase-like Zn-dependent oxidoreductase
LKFPLILGNDGAGTLEDGTHVAIYPVVGGDDWRGNETLDPHWHIFSELLPGSFADYIAVPNRNAVPVPEGMSMEVASVLGTAWLTAYRALFVRANIMPGQRLLVQGAKGGMATALIQLGAAAGAEVWVTSRDQAGRAFAESLGAARTFAAGEALAQKADVVVDNVGPATWEHSLASVARNGIIVLVGVTTGLEVRMPLLMAVSHQLSLLGSVMGTREDMVNMINFIQVAGIKPYIGGTFPMSEAPEAFRRMWEGDTQGKLVLTR